MQKRYLKILGSAVWATDNINVQDLVDLRNGIYNAILDLETWRMFDPETNSWRDIPGKK